MDNIHLIEKAAQSPLSTANAVAGFNDAIRNARFALLKGPLDSTIVGLEEASRLAAEAKNPHAHELTNLAGALEPALETVKLVEMYFLDMFPDL